jgi:hypothetical protein
LTRRTKARLTGAIRLVPEVDTIGVPVFTALRGNSMFVPEMDGDFGIRNLLEFYNEQGFRLAYDLPAEFRNQTFEVGSSAPIPFWISGACHVIIGDADKGEPEKLFGREARRNPVLLDIARLLDDARSGRINDRFDEWAAETISNSFADVFYETPVRSRYWVTRYRIAVAKARKMTQPPHPIDVKLRQVATEWFHKFGSKTELSKIGGMLGRSSNEIFSRRQITDILFAFLMNKLTENNMPELESYFEEGTLHKAFPDGLYGYFIDNGWPRVPFEYTQDRNFIERMVNELVRGDERDDFRLAAKMAFLMFGRSKLPEQVDSLALTYLKRTLDGFNSFKSTAREIFRERDEKHQWRTYAEELLNLYNQLMDIDGIINGKDRMKREPINHRFGVTLDYLKDLKLILKGDW